MDGDTALMRAAAEGHASVVAQLLEAKAGHGAHQYFDSGAALICAASAGSDGAAGVLLEAGVDVDVTDADGHSALARAAEHGRTEMVTFLLAAGADLETKVRKTPSWPRSWASVSLLSLYPHRNARANLHILGQPDTLLDEGRGRLHGAHAGSFQGAQRHRWRVIGGWGGPSGRGRGRPQCAVARRDNVWHECLRGYLT
jgi:hypothetical protein